MLRDSIKITFCGLILSMFLAVGCSSTRPLLQGGSSRGAACDLKIVGDPYHEYKVRNIVESSIASYVKNLENYKFNIKLSVSIYDVIFTERQVAKKMLRAVAHVEVSDKQYTSLGSRAVDAFTTYEVCDNLPNSVQSSEKQALDAALTELANSIVLAISSIVNN